MSQLRRFRPVNTGDDTPPIAAEAAAQADARVAAIRDVQPETAEEYVAEISRLWTRAQKAFLEIGKLLIRAKVRLPHGAYTAHVEEQLPFSPRTAHMLRSAAEWALEMERSGKITLDRLPGSYTTIYLLATMEPVAVEQALADGIVRPDVRRTEILAWRRERFGIVRSRQELEALRERLRREREKLDSELARIEAELAGRVIDSTAEEGGGEGE
jgi:Protein of unknown function (DUF3102)